MASRLCVPEAVRVDSGHSGRSRRDALACGELSGLQTARAGTSTCNVRCPGPETKAHSRTIGVSSTSSARVPRSSGCAPPSRLDLHAPTDRDQRRADSQRPDPPRRSGDASSQADARMGGATRVFQDCRELGLQQSHATDLLSRLVAERYVQEARMPAVRGENRYVLTAKGSAPASASAAASIRREFARRRLHELIERMIAANADALRASETVCARGKWFPLHLASAVRGGQDALHVLLREELRW
jgi:hypothetical protein